MFAQAAQTITDSAGFGAAEWVAILTGISLVLGSITTLIVMVLKLRTENRDQHDANLKSSSERFDELNDKVDNVAHEQMRHVAVDHRNKRRW